MAEHPSLRGGHLVKMQDIVRSCAGILAHRDDAADHAAVPYLIASSAGLCLMTAMAATLQSRPQELAGEIDALMARVDIR